MKKKIGLLICSLGILSVLVVTKVDTLLASAKANKAMQATKVRVSSQLKSNEGHKLSEIDTTWGEFLNSYMKENPQIKDYNPRQDITKEHEVKVIKTEYTDGVFTKGGYFKYGLITNVYDEKTGELLTSAGQYKK